MADNQEPKMGEKLMEAASALRHFASKDHWTSDDERAFNILRRALRINFAGVRTFPMADLAFKIGDQVEKFTGEARYRGTIVAAYLTTNGAPRYVIDVEPQHFQMIATPTTIRAVIRTTSAGRQALDQNGGAR